MYFWEGLFTLLTVVTVFVFVFSIVKMALKHAQNMKRIEKGYPTLDGARPDGYTEMPRDIYSERLQ